MNLSLFLHLRFFEELTPGSVCWLGTVGVRHLVDMVEGVVGLTPVATIRLAYPVSTIDYLTQWVQ